MDPKSAMVFDPEERRKYIGGSDIAAVMGLNRWQTPLSLWAQKTGKVPPCETNEAMELGIELEETVARLFTKRTSMKCRRDRRDFVHPDYPYMVAHIDRWILETDAILECKTCNAWKAKEWEGSDVPVEYCLQLNWYMGLVALVKKRPIRSGFLAVLIGGQKHIVTPLKFDQGLFDSQVSQARSFWENFVLKNEPPMAMAGDTDTLLALFPQVKTPMLEIKDPEKVQDLNAAFERRNELLREKDAVAKDLDEIDVKFKQIIGEAPGLITDAFKITWTPQTSRRADPDAMRAAGVFEQYSKESNTRVLRVSQLKEKKGK